MTVMVDEARLDLEVDQAVAPYRDIVPPHVLERMRQMLKLTLLTHPDVAPLTRAYLPAKEIEQSGETGPDVDAAKTTKKPAAGDGG